MRHRSKNKLSKGIIVLVLLVLGIGYAYLSTTLSINGTTDIDSNSWNVYWDNVQVQNGSVTGNLVTQEPTISNQTSLSFNVRLSKPGDYYEFTVDAVNSGTIDAMIDSINSTVNGQPISSLPSYLEYEISYIDNLEIEGNHLLRHDSMDHYRVKISYKKDIQPSELPNNNEELLLNFGVAYNQADSSARTVANRCYYNGVVSQGSELIQGQYTYRYKQELRYAEVEPGHFMLAWQSDGVDPNAGWAVKLSDWDSEDPVTTPPCHFINGLPITDMSYMLSCSAQSIDLSGFYTTNVTDMHNMFGFTNNMTLDFSGFDTSNVTDMGQMFQETQIQNLDLSHFDTSNVTNMSGMFTDAEYLYSLNISSFNTSKVTDMSYMFNDIIVPTLDLSHFDTSNVTDMSFMFAGNKSTSINLSSFNTSKVTNMAYMFDYSRAPILDLSSFDMSNVQNTYRMFSGCTATTGYARTQADANILNSSSNKPSALTFVVH